MRFNKASERRQNRSPDNVQPMRNVFIPDAILTVDKELLKF